MCIYLYVCMYVCVFICMCVYVCVCYVLCVYVCVRMCVCICVYVRIYVFVCVYVYKHMYWDIIGGLITPVHSLMLSLSLPVYQVTLERLPLYSFDSTQPLRCLASLVVEHLPSKQSLMG